MRHLDITWAETWHCRSDWKSSRRLSRPFTMAPRLLQEAPDKLAQFSLNLAIVSSGPGHLLSPHQRYLARWSLPLKSQDVCAWAHTHTPHMHHTCMHISAHTPHITRAHIPHTCTTYVHTCTCHTRTCTHYTYTCIHISTYHMHTIYHIPHTI